MTDSPVDSSERGASRTFIEEARRRQIVDAAVDVIARHGLPNASLARIAQHAGISKGVISYHFDGKDDLLQQILEDYDQAEREAIWSNVEGAGNVAEELQRYIDAYVDFIGSRPQQLKAVLEIIFSLRDEAGKLQVDISSQELLEQEIQPLVLLLGRGQESGEFRSFDRHVMAMLIRGAIDNVALSLASRPDANLDHYREELNRTFALATHAGEQPEQSGQHDTAGT